MISNEDPHRERHPWGHITYWKGGLACFRSDAWDRVRVE